MKNFIVLGDTHLGVRNDSLIFHNFFKQFYEYLFQYMEDANIDTILQLGDLWDRRKFVSFQTLYESRKYFFNELKKRNIKLITLLGNHDVMFRNTLEVNSSTLLLQEYDNIQIIDKPTELEISGIKIAILPWICSDNYDESLNFINNTTAKYCAGHLELSGFEMHRGQICEDGFSPDTFKKFDLVMTGHYHHRSTRGNVTYVGTPYEMTWHDYNDAKGFHIFNVNKKHLAFAQNPYSIFVRLEYNDKNQSPIDLTPLNLQDTFVKLVVVNKTDFYLYEQFVNKIYQKGCYDVKIIEDMSEFEAGEINNDDINLEDTFSILSNYIDSLDTDIDTDKLKNYMKSLYIEALNIEVV